MVAAWAFHFLVSIHVSVRAAAVTAAAAPVAGTVTALGVGIRAVLAVIRVDRGVGGSSRCRLKKSLNVESGHGG
jgi:hypothetical protein